MMVQDSIWKHKKNGLLIRILYSGEPLTIRPVGRRGVGSDRSPRIRYISQKSFAKLYAPVQTTSFNQYCEEEGIKRYKEAFWRFCSTGIANFSQDDQVPVEWWEKLYQKYIS